MTDPEHRFDYVFDATGLNHFARIDRLDVPRALLVERSCGTTVVVREELRAGIEQHPELVQALDQDWLAVVPLDGHEELTCFVKWSGRVGAGMRDLGRPVSSRSRN